MKELTLLVTTMNRAPLLKVFFDYYQSIGFEGQIIVGDASARPYTLPKSSPSNFKIVHLKNEKSQIQSLLELTRLVETEYSLFCGDDDYLISQKFVGVFENYKQLDPGEYILNLNYCALFVDEHHLPINISFPYFSRDLQVGPADHAQKVSNLIQYARVYRSFMFTVASTAVWEKAYEFAANYKSKAVSAEIAIGAFLVANYSITLADDFPMVRLQHPKRFSLPEDNFSLAERAKLAIDLLGEEAYSKPLNELFLSAPPIHSLRQEAAKSHSLDQYPYAAMKPILNSLRPDIYQNSQLSFIYWGNQSTLRHGLDFARSKAKKNEKFLLIMDSNADQLADERILKSYDDILVGSVRLNTFLSYEELDQIHLLASNLEGEHRFISISSVLPLERLIIEKIKPIEVLLYWPHMSNLVHHPTLVKKLKSKNRRPLVYVPSGSFKRFVYYITGFTIGVLDRMIGIPAMHAISSREIGIRAMDAISSPEFSIPAGKAISSQEICVERPTFKPKPNLELISIKLIRTLVVNQKQRGELEGKTINENSTITNKPPLPVSDKRTTQIFKRMKFLVKSILPSHIADIIAHFLRTFRGCAKTLFGYVKMIRRVSRHLLAALATPLFIAEVLVVSMLVFLNNFRVYLMRRATYGQGSSPKGLFQKTLKRLFFYLLLPLRSFFVAMGCTLEYLFHFLVLPFSSVASIKRAAYRADKILTGKQATNSFVDSCLRHRISYLGIYFASKLNVISSVVYFTISIFRSRMISDFHYDAVTQIGAFSPYGKLAIFVPSSGEAGLMRAIYPHISVEKVDLSGFRLGGSHRKHRDINASMSISVGLMPKNQKQRNEFAKEVSSILEMHAIEKIVFRPHPLMTKDEINWYLQFLKQEVGVLVNVDNRLLENFLRDTDLLLTSVSGIVCEIDEQDHHKITLLESISKNLFPDLSIIYDLYPQLGRSN